MRASLFVTCLVDQFWPSAGVAAVRVLRRAGCEVTFDGRQTCCGQPASNAGHRAEARAVARRTIEHLERDGSAALVLPSGSCTAALRLWRELFEDEPAWRERGEAVATRAHELSSFLVNVLGIDELGARFEGRISWHDACHGLRELGLREEPRRLLRNVRGAELVEAARADSCCGFGGTFSVRYPEISVAMLDQKLDELEALGIDAVVSGDVGCLLQIGGRLARRGSRIRPLHLAELLASEG